MSSIVKLFLIIIIITSLTLEFVLTLANCPAVCICNDVTLEVHCGEGNLGVVPIALNPSIKRLVIKNNKIKSIDSSIQFYPELTYLDLSYNHLLIIPQRTFGYQKKLQELHLNHNKIGSITNITFIGLTTLSVLNLRGNFLNELNNGVFTLIPTLEELNLGQNRITKIDAGAFDGLKTLRILYLDDNNLTSVPSPSFLNLRNLAELYLGINSFITISKGAFEHLNELNRLDLRGARLVNISLETFKGLEESLRILDLSDNRLQRIPTVELSTLVRLEELSLGQNDFEIIPEGAFVGMTNLRKLEVSGSLPLRKIQIGAFSSNTNLETLIISSNKVLADVQEGALSGLPHLKTVILRGNAITTFAEGLFPWNELHTFDLSENPIHCDCRVLWLRNLLITKNLSQTSETVLCASPERLREEPLRILSSDLLGCAHTDSRRQALIGAFVVATAATITALALVIYRCRRRIREILKGGWGNSALGRKEREYQKTFSDEDYMSRQTAHPCSLGVHPSLANYSHNPHHPHHPGIRPIPVTEL